MYNIRAAPACHDTVGMGIGLDGRDDLRQPVQRDVGRDDANKSPVFVF